jgi:sortase A
MGHREARNVLPWIQRLAVAAGLGCLAWVGMVTLQANLHDRQQRRLFEQQRVAPAASVASAPRPSGMEPSNGLIGLLEIPRLGFSEIVMHGDDDDTLALAIGHLPDTPLPWQQGNSALAGHRDGRFRPLKDVRIGDRITIATRQGYLHYVLRETKIVTPDDLSVLAPTSARTLTLITCYPFSYVGKAPKRFILKAEAVEGPVFRETERP